MSFAMRALFLLPEVSLLIVLLLVVRAFLKGRPRVFLGGWQDKRNPPHGIRIPCGGCENHWRRFSEGCLED